MTKNKLTNIFRGATSVAVILLILVLSLGMLANANAGAINNFLGITFSNKNNGGDGEVRYASSYGELNDENCRKLVADEDEYCAQQLEEGSVLLKNNGALPLKSTERKVTLFGRASADIVYRGVCGGPAVDPTRAIDMRKAFENAGFSVNGSLYDAYAASTTKRVKSTGETESIGEENIEFYSSALKNTFSSFGDVAIVVLSRLGGEGDDKSMKDADGVASLSLHQSEADMLKMIADSGVFKKTVVLINSVYPIEIGWLDEYGVDACLWIGNPGYYGLPGVVNVLTGAANPSGKLPDTYATNSFSSAAMQNFGENSYLKADEVSSYAKNYTVYAEGIYVGYKYYETRYEDCVLGNGNANGSAGVYASSGGKWNYADEVVYPFGFGLSYTTFEQTLDSCEYDANTDSFSAKVTVKNVGDVSGKDVIQLYAQSPYKVGGTEKSAVQLVAYGKTDELKNGEEKTYELNFPRYFLASYDDDETKGYVLDDGIYYFGIGNDAHDALNNILEAKGATGMTDHDGNSVTGNVAETAKYTLAETDTSSYANSQYTGNKITNLFDDADINSYYDSDVVTYLTRSDWEGTWPKRVSLSINDKLKVALDNNVYDMSSGKPLTECVYGTDGDIKFVDLVGKDYDDPMWDALVKQLSVTELASLSTEAYGSTAVESIGKPFVTTTEGPEGCAGTYLYGDKGRCTGYASLPVLAATWSHEMQTKFGNFYGEDALFAGVAEVNGPCANLHRTPYGGRTPEYFSEDAILSYYAAGNAVKAMREKGLITNIKHFAMNEQEFSRMGVSTFAEEQCMRELYFRAFEGAFTFGKTVSVMTSYNRIGCTYSAVHSVLQNEFLRGEWGFLGFTLTDYTNASEYSSTKDGIMNGTNTFGGSDRKAEIAQLVMRNNNGDMLEKLQETAKRVLWADSKCSITNGMTRDTKVATPIAWWQIAITAIEIALGVLTAAALGLYIFTKVRANRVGGEI